MELFSTEVYYVYPEMPLSGRLSSGTARLDSLAPGEVLVRMKAVSLNYRDLLVIDDAGPSYDRPRLIPVSDGAGVVEEAGEGVTSVKPGDRVMPCFFTRWISGSYRPEYRDSALGGGVNGLLAEYTILPAESLVKVPSSYSYEEAACLPCAAVTAWKGLVKTGRLAAGENVLIQGTGGVSIFALQIVKSFGATAIVLSGDETKIAKAGELGADHCINYRLCPDWPAKVLEITGGRGVDHIVEVVGNRNLAGSVSCLAAHGRIAYVGCLGGFEGGFDPLSLLYKNASLNAVYVGSRDDLMEVAQVFSDRDIRPSSDHMFPFKAAAEAFDYMRNGRHFGKIVITF